jgi:hypothetical protein
MCTLPTSTLPFSAQIRVLQLLKVKKSKETMEHVNITISEVIISSISFYETCKNEDILLVFWAVD